MPRTAPWRHRPLADKTRHADILPCIVSSAALRQALTWELPNQRATHRAVAVSTIGWLLVPLKIGSAGYGLPRRGVIAQICINRRKDIRFRDLDVRLAHDGRFLGFLDLDGRVLDWLACDSR